MKKFLCYDTNDAASGKINVSTNGVLSPNATVPSTNGATNQQLVTDGDGNVKWEDRLAYTTMTKEVKHERKGVSFHEFTSNGRTGIYTSGALNYWNMDIPEFILTLDGIDYTLERCEESSYLGNGNLIRDNLEDNGLPVCLQMEYFSEEDDHHYCVYTNLPGSTHDIVLSALQETAVQIPEQYIPTMSSITLKSSTSGSSKKFKITVNDSGTITATEV